MLSIIVPVYNEEKNLPEFFLRLGIQLGILKNRMISYEVIINDNCSSDESWLIIEQFCKNNEFVFGYRLNRNYGFQASILQGLKKSTGDASLVLQSDLQNPPELVEKLVERWQKTKSKIILAVPENNYESKLMFLVRKLFYTLLFSTSRTPKVMHFQDFYLLERSVYEELIEHPIENQFIRSHILKHIKEDNEIIHYHKSIRKNGKTSFSFGTLYDLALDALLVNQNKLLKVLSMFALATSLISLFAILVIILLWLFGVRAGVIGYTSLVTLFLFWNGISLFIISMVLEYVKRIYSVTLHPGKIVLSQITKLEKNA